MGSAAGSDFMQVTYSPPLQQIGCQLFQYAV
jgi:hypothetical protein